MNYDEISKLSEFVPEWDVYRDEDGEPVTVTWAQARAVERAMQVLVKVEQQEGGSAKPHLSKSRLLGRMLFQGRPPTRTKPPHEMGACAWWRLPGGDPFETVAEREERLRVLDEQLLNGVAVLVCDECGNRPLFNSRALHEEHMRMHA